MNPFKGSLKQYIFFISLSIMAAVGNMGMIFLFNDIIQNVITESAFLEHKYFLYFFGSLFLFFSCRFIVSLSIISFTQNLLGKTRLEVMEVVLKSSFFPLMNSKERIYTAMTRDVGNVVHASISIVDIITNIIIIFISFIYLGFLSWELLLCLIGLIIFTLSIYITSERKGRKLLDQAMGHEDTFIRYLNETLTGFKEVIIDRKKGRAIKAIHIDTAIKEVIGLNKRAFVIFLNNRIIGQIAFYIFIGLVLLYFGNLFSVASEILISFVFTVLYVFGPIESIIVMIPGLSQATSSINRLLNLQKDLEESETIEDDNGSYEHFQKLSIKELTYQYKVMDNEDKPFVVGPLNFRLNRGNIVFVSGGNGSGKTTFINLLIGLHTFDKGSVSINGELVESTVSAKYRSLFAPVFNDFHLFDRCYGINEVDLEQLTAYLYLFELEHKVTFKDGSFSSIRLSTGQRKRLALICALLEQKPIIILDEFAADQDPEFRRKFYFTILPALKKKGFTIVAVTHDDYYYDCCDFRYHMKDGKIRKMEIEKRPLIET